MATCFGIVKLPICINQTTIPMKSVFRTPRHYLRSDSSSPLFKHIMNRRYLIAPTSWLLKPLIQKNAFSHSATHKISLLKLTGVSDVTVKNTHTSESEKNQKLNVKNAEYNKVVPKYVSSSSKACSKSVPSCPVLCPMCHGNVGYCCNDRTINDLISLKPVPVADESAAEVRKTETRATEMKTENKVEKDELNKVIPNFELNNTWPSIKPTENTTDSQRIILCPMCHRHIVHGLRNAEKRTYRVVPIIANQTKALNFVAEVKQTTGIDATVKTLNAEYKKVIPKCPDNDSCPSCPPPCPPYPCQPFPCCPPCPSCPPCPCSPPCPPCPCPPCPYPPYPCPQCPQCPPQSRSPTSLCSPRTSDGK